MKKLFFLSIFIAILAAFFASAYPDGLDFVAEKSGFAERGPERRAPMPDYSVKFLPEGGVSTAAAGVAGVLIVLALFWLTAAELKRNGKNSQTLAAFLVISFTMIGFVGSPAHAARPLITDDFYTVAEGGYELEAGYTATENQDCYINSAGLSFKRGILSNFDLGIEVPYTIFASSGVVAGLNDIYLHAKYCFLKTSADDGLTARLDYKFNNGNVSHGLGSGDNDYWLVLIASKIFGQTKTHYNLGYVNVGYNAGRLEDDYVAYSAALEYPAFGEQGDLVAELVGNTSLVPNPLFVQLGGRGVLVEGFKLDAGYSVGLKENSIKNAFTAGIHWEF